MKFAIRLSAALAALVPSVALACPYAASASAADCSSCASSSLGYVAAVLIGLGAGFASVGLERRRGR